MIYNWNIDEWIKNETPEEIRTEENVSFVQALLKPLKRRYVNFLNFRVATLKKMRYNGQTIILENLLNDMFDPVQRRIRVVTVSDVLEPPYIYQQSENQPLYVYTQAEYDADPLLPRVWLMQTGELWVHYDFIVEAAAGSLTALQIIRLKAIVNYYRIAGKKPFYQYDNLIPF